MLQELEIKALKGESKTSRLKIKPDPEREPLKKPKWIRIRHTNSNKVNELKKTLRSQELFTVCEEAQCPNLSECFNHGTATFMIMGQICTRRCPFCDVAHGRPKSLDLNEPFHLADTISKMSLKYVVITSVDRDDLIDGGAEHFSKVIHEVRKMNNSTTIEVLTPDFLRKGKAFTKVVLAEPDVFNHNIETVPSLYLKVRPGSRYFASLELLKSVKQMDKTIFTKSGIMLGMGEKRDEILQVMDDLKSADVDFITIGQYLQPSVKHHPLERYVHPDEFKELKRIAESKGFLIVASSPLTRSSYHADEDFRKMKQLRDNQSQCHPLQ